MPRLAIQCAIALTVFLALADQVAGHDGVSDSADAGSPRLTVQAGVGTSSPVFSPDGRYIASAAGAVRLWNTSRGDLLRRFDDDNAIVYSIDFSPDGKYLVGGRGSEHGGGDGTVLIWDVASGAVIQRLTGHAKAVPSVAYSSNGNFVASASLDGTVRLWDVASGKEMRRFDASNRSNRVVAISPDGKQVLGAGYKSLRLWDAKTGEILRSAADFQGTQSSLAFSPDGRYFATGGKWDPVRIWDTEKFEPLYVFGEPGVPTAPGHGGSSFSFSPDSRFLILLSRNEIFVVSVDDGSIKRVLGSQWTDSQFGAALSPDGELIAAATESSIRLHDFATGAKQLELTGKAAQAGTVAFSPDGTQVLSVHEGIHTVVWDLASGTVTAELDGSAAGFTPDDGRVLLTSYEKPEPETKLVDVGDLRKPLHLDDFAGLVNRAGYSADGRRFIVGSTGSLSRVWEVKADSVEQIQRLEEDDDGRIDVVALSPDGQYAATSGYFTRTRIWSVKTGYKLRDLENATIIMRDLAFSPDGKIVAGGHMHGDISLWEVATGKEVRLLTGHTDAANSVSYSRDGKYILSGSWDHTARLWNATTGDLVQEFVGHSDRIMTADLSPDGRYVVTGGEDYSVRLWDVATGKELCRMFAFYDYAWAVIDSEGRFDGSNGGDVDGLHWVVGLDTIALGQLKQRYYEPGLLAKKLKLSREPLSDVAAFQAPELFPAVKVDESVAQDEVLPVTLLNQGGGIGKVSVFVNGKEISADARLPGADPYADAMNLDINLKDQPLLRQGDTNEIEIRAYNAEGYLSSRGITVSYQAPGQKADDDATLWAVVAGVSDYPGQAIDLKYAAKDAEDMATALSLGAGRLFGVENVNVRLLTTGQAPSSVAATKSQFERTFTELRSAKPTDILVVYLAGHGVTYDDDYYFLTEDAKSADVSDPAVRSRSAVSAGEMIEWLKQSPAQKQVMILDTCAAGAVETKFVDPRNVSSQQIRAIERLKDRTGFHVLMGSAADQVSYEATQYRQGLLTHALLRGMRGEALRDNEFVDVSQWFQHAADQVPRLARNIGGIQRPRIAAPRGTSFDIGQLDATDRSKIPLSAPRPFMLPPVILSSTTLFDDLGLQAMLRAYLRELSYRVEGETVADQFVYVDAEEMPGAVRLSGNYEVANERITARLVLVRDGQQESRVEATGSTDDLNELTTRIVAGLFEAMSATN